MTSDGWVTSAVPDVQRKDREKHYDHTVIVLSLFVTNTEMGSRHGTEFHIISVPKEK